MSRKTASIHAVILAAGQGTRMKSALPKVLHTVGGRPMLAHVLDAARAAGATQLHVVHGHGADAVRAAFAGAADLNWVMQAQQLGTAHAVLQAMPHIPDDALVLVLSGDVPLTSADTLRQLAGAGASGLALCTVALAQPHGYGRIVRDARKNVRGIVEEKDASAAQRKITEIYSGLLAAPARRLKKWLAKVGNRNAKGEYYLTDVVALAVKDKVKVAAVSAASADEVEGVNDRAQLARIERAYQQAAAQRLMREGLHIADPARFDLRGTLRHGRDCRIDVGVIVEGDCELGDDVSIGPYTVLRSARLGSGTRVDAHCVIDFADAGRNCIIGPYARLRPESRLGDGVHIGNFVELKKTTMGDGAKANHLAYLGDAEIGARSNIGAGVITCNYDGAHKHKTTVGADAFVGTDSQLIAPVTVGDRAYIAAGSTISRDAPADALTICRAREQRVIPGWKRPQKKK